MTTWETVIGLEVHAQLNTDSKLFSGAATAYGAEPNTQACIVDLGFPGVLPVLNQKAVEMAVTFGLAIDAEIPPYSIFARKNYFYPDLPKGYQISQFNHPVVGQGELSVQLEDGSQKIIGITRAHLEEDAGKSLHEDFHGKTGVDLNRAGTPLLEIVSEPDMRSASEAVAYLKTLHALVCCIGICNGNMQEGSFRCDANVSIRPKGSTSFGTRTEIKNVNSFRFVEKAIEFEVARQIAVIESGDEVVQETRLYDAEKNETRAMRSKEEAQDYRYFSDPDLLPLQVSQTLKDQLHAKLPELPHAKRQRFIEAYGLSQYDANTLVSNQGLSACFDTILKTLGTEHAKLTANWLMGDVSAALNQANLDFTNAPINAQDIIDLLARIIDQTISGKIAKTVFEALWQGKGTVDEIIEQQGLKQVTDTSAIATIIDDVLAANPNQLEQYRSGKDKLFGFFVGQVMKQSKGKANPQQVNALLKEKLG